MADQTDLDQMREVRKKWLEGQRVSEVRFSDGRVVRYSELNIGVIDAEINRLKTALGESAPRMRPVRLRGL